MSAVRVLYDGRPHNAANWQRGSRRNIEPAAPAAAPPDPTPPPATDEAPKKTDKQAVTISTQVTYDGGVYTVQIQAPLTPATLRAFAKKLKAQGLEPVPPPLQWTPEGEPICPKHRVLMSKRNKQGEIWYSHAIKSSDGKPILDNHGDPIYCRGHGVGKSSPGWDHPVT